MKLQFVKNPIILCFCILVLSAVGCSSGGGGGNGQSGPTYSGVTDPAAIDADNAEAIGKTSTESVEQAVSSDAANDANPLTVVITGNSTSSVSEVVLEIVKQVADNIKNIEYPIGLTLTSDDLGEGYCGGTITIPDSDLESESFNFTATFNNVCYEDPSSGERIFMDGILKVSETETSSTTEFINFKVTQDGVTETINAKIVCDDFTNCSFVSDYVGSDGQIYRLADINVTGNETSGFFISATFFHPDFGSVSLQTTVAITFNCSNGFPDAGTLVFTGDNGTSGSISFRSDCTGYDGTYNDGVNSGAFSGDWS